MESLIFLVVMFGLMWVLFVLPRQRMQRQHQAMVSALQVGDEVITSAGIYGTVTDLEPDAVHVRVAEGVVVRVARLAIGRRLTEGPEATGAAEGEAATDRDPGSPED